MDWAGTSHRAQNVPTGYFFRRKPLAVVGGGDFRARLGAGDKLPFGYAKTRVIESTRRDAFFGASKNHD